MKRHSIGNDIVALNNINAEKTRQPQFYSKFLSQPETDLYNNKFSIPFEHFAWLCWSIKESVFKFQKRIQPELVFSFRNINIQQVNIPRNNQVFNFQEDVAEYNCLPEQNCYNSVTAIGSSSFYSHSYISKDFIYTITVDEAANENIFWGVKFIDDPAYSIQSKSVREFVLQKLHRVSGETGLDILKSEVGYPYVNKYRHIPVSFTHHHNFIGYSFLF
jgi:phosphopantetheinyl transferase (holo-ACP synthase)